MEIKTAQDFIDLEEPVKLKEWREIMIEFAKYHVEIALEHFKENTTWGIYQNDDGQEPFDHESNIFVDFQRIDEKQILEVIQ